MLARGRLVYDTVGLDCCRGQGVETMLIFTSKDTCMLLLYDLPLLVVPLLTDALLLEPRRGGKRRINDGTVLYVRPFSFGRCLI